MVNQSKINDPRYWKKWRQSGAVEDFEDAYIRKIWGSEVLAKSGEKIKRVIKEYGENRWWESDDPVQVATYQAFQDILLVDFSKFHEGLEKIVGRPVWTHELGMNVEGIRAEAAQGLARMASGQETSDHYKQQAAEKSIQMLADHCRRTGKPLLVYSPEETPSPNLN